MLFTNFVYMLYAKVHMKAYGTQLKHPRVVCVLLKLPTVTYIISFSTYLCLLQNLLDTFVLINILIL